MFLRHTEPVPLRGGCLFTVGTGKGAIIVCYPRGSGGTCCITGRVSFPKSRHCGNL